MLDISCLHFRTVSFHSLSYLHVSMMLLAVAEIVDVMDSPNQLKNAMEMLMAIPVCQTDGTSKKSWKPLEMSKCALYFPNKT